MKQVDIRLSFRKLHESPGHVTYGLWVNGGKAGDLTVRQSERAGLTAALTLAGAQHLELEQPKQEQPET